MDWIGEMVKREESTAVSRFSARTPEGRRLSGQPRVAEERQVEAGDKTSQGLGLKNIGRQFSLLYVSLKFRAANVNVILHIKTHRG